MKNKNLLIDCFVVLGCFIFLAIAGYTFYYNYMCQDHAEHLHASWLVWQGNVPYRDFFEHHHPLLWFVLAPIVALFYNNPIILYVSRGIEFFMWVVLFWGVYKIASRFLGLSKRTILLGILFYLFVPCSISLLFELSPDVFMWASFWWGFYFYCSYLEEGKLRDLSICFTLFLLSFLFLQKIALLLFILGIFILYFLFKKKIRVINLLKALIVPAIIIGLFVLYLVCTDSFDEYIRLNFDFNLQIGKFYGADMFLDEYEISLLFPLMAIFCVRNFIKKEGREYRIQLVSIMYLDYIIKGVTFAPYCQYFVFSNIVSGLIVAECIVNKINLKRIKLFFIAIVIALGFFQSVRSINKNFPLYYDTHKIFMKNTTKDDYILNTVMYFFNIYGKNPDYYWFGYQNSSLVANYLYGNGDYIDLNQIIINTKPKVIFATPYFNLMVLENYMHINYYNHLMNIYDSIDNRGEGKVEFAKKFVNPYPYVIDEVMINNNYTNWGDSNVLIRRDLF